jgi:predicted nucleic acid-binding protein
MPFEAAMSVVAMFAAASCSRDSCLPFNIWDPDDDKFIDAALTARVAIIVSGDRHLLDLGTVDGIEILTARQFLDRLPALREESDSTTR